MVRIKPERGQQLFDEEIWTKSTDILQVMTAIETRISAAKQGGFIKNVKSFRDPCKIINK